MADFEMLIAACGEEFFIKDDVVFNDVFKFSAAPKKLDFGTEYSPEIIFAQNVKMDRFSVKFLFKQPFESESLFFNNANTTNDWVGIEKIGDNRFVSRDIA